MKSTRQICVLVILGLLVGSAFIGNTSANGDPADDPAGMIDDVIDEVQDLADTGELNTRQANSVIVKLDGAKDSFDRGNYKAAVGKLNSARHQIEGLANGGHISEVNRATLYELITIPCFIICAMTGPIQTACINICCPPVV
jgi:hypothetical protein